MSHNQLEASTYEDVSHPIARAPYLEAVTRVTALDADVIHLLAHFLVLSVFQSRKGGHLENLFG
jgi:hypothetical protein